MSPTTTSRPRDPRPALLLILLACSPAPAAPRPTPAPLERATQLVVVNTAGWDATAGELRRFERVDRGSPWYPIPEDGEATPVVIGRGGLGWGVGFDTLAAAPETTGPRKVEGDGRSPAGVFALDRAFGFAPADSTPAAGLSYLALGPGTECVDDTSSAYYARVVDRADVAEPDWQSAERMRAISLYRLGVLVDYNTGRTPGRGSCIFLHIWDGPASTTSGCSALAADPLEGLVAWLDADARPALVQLPTPVYHRLRADWGLPPLRGIPTPISGISR